MLKVSEIFGPTVQGEGKSVGKEVLFLRLATCNLHCIWCDTPYTWNWVGTKFAHPKKFDPTVEVREMSELDILIKLYELDVNQCRALVVSGGEPLIQGKQLTSFLTHLHRKQEEDLYWWRESKEWWVEVETNGTIAPSRELDNLVDQFNCSPKLSNSGDERRLRVRPQALSKLADNPKVFFKFVIASEQDIVEILEYVKTYRIHSQKVYLMPLGATREELDQTRGATQQMAQQYGFNFSDRLHVVQFGGVRGV